VLSDSLASAVLVASTSGSAQVPVVTG